MGWNWVLRRGRGMRENLRDLFTSLLHSMFHVKHGISNEQPEPLLTIESSTSAIRPEGLRRRTSFVNDPSHDATRGNDVLRYVLFVARRGLSSYLRAARNRGRIFQATDAATIALTASMPTKGRTPT